MASGTPACSLSSIAVKPTSSRSFSISSAACAHSQRMPVSSLPLMAVKPPALNLSTAWAQAAHASMQLSTSGRQAHQLWIPSCSSVALVQTHS